jgi:hypothetical protein
MQVYLLFQLYNIFLPFDEQDDYPLRNMIFHIKQTPKILIVAWQWHDHRLKLLASFSLLNRCSQLFISPAIYCFHEFTKIEVIYRAL